MNEPQLSDHQVARTELKYQHALDLMSDLGDSVATWNTLEQVTMAPSLVKARRIEYLLHIRSPAPEDEWSLTFADALHNFRSALDTLAWEVANLDPARPPSKPKDIYFPTAKNETEWKGWAKRLSDIPALYLERMKLNLQIVSEGNIPVVAELHQLDIDDKHRGLLQSTAGVDASKYHLEIVPPPGTSTITGTLTPIPTPRIIPIEEGALVGGYTSSVDVALAGDAPQPVLLTPSLELNGLHLRVGDFSVSIAQTVRLVIDLVRYGQEVAVQQAIRSGAVRHFSPHEDK